MLLLLPTPFVLAVTHQDVHVVTRVDHEIAVGIGDDVGKWGVQWTFSCA